MTQNSDTLLVEFKKKYPSPNFAMILLWGGENDEKYKKSKKSIKSKKSKRSTKIKKSKRSRKYKALK
jgi:hypothetical protein